MIKNKITTQITSVARMEGVNYIAQTTNTKNNIHFFYSTTRTVDSDTVAVWRLLYKSSSKIKNIR